MPTRMLRIGILADPNDVHVRRWCAGLASRGLDVCIICGRLPERRIPGVEYLEFRVPGFGFRYPHRRAVRFRRRFQELFRAFDIVHMHNLHNWGIDEAIVSCGRLMISTYGDDVLSGPPHDGIREHAVEPNGHNEEMKKSVLALADHITATSAFLAGATSEYGTIPRDQIEVIHFGVDPQLFTPTHVSRAEKGRVGYCGGFRPMKGAANLIQAAPLVWERFWSCTFDLHGSNGTRPQCEAMVKTRGYEPRIRFHDFVPHPELPRVLDTFDVLAIPSTWESESYCVLAVEAQAMEVPVVASRIGGLPETVPDGRTGLLVEPGSPEELARGICELLGNEEKRRDLGRAGREWVKTRHDWSRCLDQMVDAYRRVMSGCSRRSHAGGSVPADCTEAARVAV